MPPPTIFRGIVCLVGGLAPSWVQAVVLPTTSLTLGLLPLENVSPGASLCERNTVSPAPPSVQEPSDERIPNGPFAVNASEVESSCTPG